MCASHQVVLENTVQLVCAAISYHSAAIELSLCQSEASRLAGDEEGSFWQRPWRLRAGVLYGWRAHRQRLTAIAAHPNELLVATAGRGHVAGQDQEVVRCWNLADAAAGDLHLTFILLCFNVLGTNRGPTDRVQHITKHSLICQMDTIDFQCEHHSLRKPPHAFGSELVKKPKQIYPSSFSFRYSASSCTLAEARHDAASAHWQACMKCITVCVLLHRNCWLTHLGGYCYSGVAGVSAPPCMYLSYKNVRSSYMNNYGISQYSCYYLYKVW